MTRGEAHIAATARLAGANYRLEFTMPAIARSAAPGQFVEVGTNGATLLNKPFSIAAVDAARGTFTLIVKVIGRGTAAIAGYEPGREVNVLGPCGNGFPLEKGPVYIVGGGIGIPPLLFLASRLPAPADAAVVLGARTAEDMVLEHEFAALTGASAVITTDDGSRGRAGFVTEALEELLALDARPVYVCGPVAMLRRVAGLCAAAGVRVHACLEAYMGCGTGICMGCVIPTVRGMERVCREGPVFLGSDVLWEQLGDA
jgi:dihydroorotate dehydrogenase electron transfer subunit